MLICMGGDIIHVQGRQESSEKAAWYEGKEYISRRWEVFG